MENELDKQIHNLKTTWSKLDKDIKELKSRARRTKSEQALLMRLSRAQIRCKEQLMPLQRQKQVLDFELKKKESIEAAREESRQKKQAYIDDILGDVKMPYDE